jgi:predicted amidohydrolase
MAKVAIIQTDIKWADPIANQLAVESALLASAPVEGADLYVLPEMWDTGFMADEQCSMFHVPCSIEFLRSLAQKYNSAIAGSMAVEEDGKRYNRLYFVTPTDICYYDKRHLFSYAGEDKTFTAGQQPVVVEWRGVRYLLQICYDLRFPCFSRNRITKDRVAEANSSLFTLHSSLFYDAIIYVANWPESRRRVWDILLQARALENQCFVIGVNRVGDDPNCHYNGGSVVIDAKGKKLAAVADNTEGIAVAELDMQSLHTFREKFPVLRDAD